MTVKGNRVSGRLEEAYRIEQAKLDESPERALCVAVLYRAIRDAMGKTDGARPPWLTIADAQRWILRSPGFVTVCAHVDLDAAVVRSRVSKMFVNANAMSIAVTEQNTVADKSSNGHAPAASPAPCQH
jgi:hypothetical protein